MLNEPARHKQPHTQQHRTYGKPILTCPPERKQKTHPQRNTRHLARNDIEPTKDQQRPYQRRPQITRGQRDSADAAAHVRHAPLVRVQGDGLDLAACAEGCDRMSELVEGDDEHFEGPEGPAHIGDVPEEGDDYDAGDYDAESGFLGVVHAEVAGLEVVVRGEEGSRIAGMGEESDV